MGDTIPAPIHILRIAMSSKRPISHVLFPILFFLPILVACEDPAVTAPASGPRLTLEDIFSEKAYEPEEPGAIKWLADGSGYTALETNAAFEDVEPEKDEEGEDIEPPQDIVFYDPETLDRSILISISQLTPEGADRALVVDDYSWSDDRSKLLIYTNSKKVWREKSRGDYWLLNLDDDSLIQLGGDDTAPSTLQFAKLSSDGANVAYVRENNIYVQDLGDRSIRQLTTDASENIINGVMSWAYEEEFQIRDGFRWSPNGERIAFWQFDTSGVRDFLLINNTDELYPTTTRIPYPKVGETISAARLGIVSLGSGETVWLRLPGDPRQMYVPRMDWANNSVDLLVQHLNRKQDTNTVYSADVRSGEVTRVMAEEELHYIEDVVDVKWLEEADDFTWLSERSGWRHIYRVSRDASSVVDLTPGEFDVIEVSKVDAATGFVYFTASPEHMEQRFLYRAPLAGGGPLERITPDSFAGTNSYDVSDDARFAIHTHSSFTQPPQYRLVSLPAHEVKHVLEDNQALIDKLASLNLGEHEFFRVDARDELALDGFIMRPSGFHPDQSYPIVNYVYGEVAGQTVRDNWGGTRHLWHFYMAQEGFVVASVDNRGTRAPRGREWRKSVYGAIGVLASRDQSDSLAAMAERWPYIDDQRVGIWGHSGGGSMTLNMLFRYPGQYHVGVSRAPVADQRLYDAIYQERYSGLLEEYADAYVEASPITHAENLQGKLLLIHGTGDDNVHYQGSERLINELVKHNKQFDFMSYPNRSHSIREGEGTELHMYTMMSRHFKEHLMDR